MMTSNTYDDILTNAAECAQQISLNQSLTSYVPIFNMTADQIIAVTDAGPFGQAVASLLIARGWRVAIYHTEVMKKHAEAILEEFGSTRVYPHVVNFSDWETWQQAIDATREVFGNAPAHAVIVCDELRSSGPIYFGGWDDKGIYSKTALVNIEAVYRALRVFLPSMVEAQRGSIVVTGSIFAERPWAISGAAAYAASKAAAVALVRTTAQEVLEHGVRVNAILFNLVDQPKSHADLPNFDSSTWVPLESIANVVGFLVSNDARDVTGALVPMFSKV